MDRTRSADVDIVEMPARLGWRGSGRLDHWITGPGEAGPSTSTIPHALLQPHTLWTQQLVEEQCRAARLVAVSVSLVDIADRSRLTCLWHGRGPSTTASAAHRQLSCVARHDFRKYGAPPRPASVAQGGLSGSLMEGGGGLVRSGAAWMVCLRGGIGSSGSAL